MDCGPASKCMSNLLEEDNTIFQSDFTYDFEGRFVEIFVRRPDEFQELLVRLTDMN